MKEICKCGHIKTMHRELREPPYGYNGKCWAEACKCKKFERVRTEPSHSGLVPKRERRWE